MLYLETLSSVLLRSNLADYMYQMYARVILCACLLHKLDDNLLDFVVNRLFTKVIMANNINILNIVAMPNLT